MLQVQYSPIYPSHPLIIKNERWKSTDISKEFCVYLFFKPHVNWVPVYLTWIWMTLHITWNVILSPNHLLSLAQPYPALNSTKPVLTSSLHISLHCSSHYCALCQVQHSTSSHSSPLHPVNLFVTVGAAPWAIAQPTLLFLSLFLHNTHQPQLNPNLLLNIVSYLQFFFKYSPCEYCCTIHSVSATLSYKKNLKSNPTLMSLISSPWISLTFILILFLLIFDIWEYFRKFISIT